MLSASCGGRPCDWPLSNHAVRSVLADKTPRQWRKSWTDVQNRLTSEDRDFPQTVDVHEPCFNGECMAELDENQRAQVKLMLTELRLICLCHAEAKKCSLPCLGFTAGPHTLYGMVGAFFEVTSVQVSIPELGTQGPSYGLGPV